LHKITTSEPHELRVDMDDFEGHSAYAEYTEFSIAGADDFYRLLCEGYSGTAGDSMAFQNGMKFSTKDADNDLWDEDCVATYRGAWWHYNCLRSNPNGAYLGGSHTSYGAGIEWKTFTGVYYYSLKSIELKIRPV
ncbi:hypothetical protein CAPTEDRAFT_129193, partial [Capitella teleta]